MARCLIIGCGCRGLALSDALSARGHAVRGTTRRTARLDVLAEAGVEPVLGDPDRVATIAPAFEQVTVVYVLLGSIAGSAADAAALHGTRLEMLLSKMLDTTIRAIVYEAAGSVERSVLAHGSELVRRTCEDSLIPYGLLDADPANHDAWRDAAAAAVDRMLVTGR
jgi:Trk K+ transport system NAD-binding subunit